MVASSVMGDSEGATAGHFISRSPQGHHGASGQQPDALATSRRRLRRPACRRQASLACSRSAPQALVGGRTRNPASAAG